MIAHHPAHELLLDFAAGGLAEGPALAVAAHVALCPGCRQSVVRLDSIGGALLDRLEPAAMGADALEKCLRRIDDAVDRTLPPASPAVHLHVGAVLPFPLQRYVDGAAKWRVSWGVEEIPIELETAGHRASRISRRSSRLSQFR